MPVLLTMPWPPSVNHYWRQFNGRAIISAEGRAYRKAVEGMLRGVAPLEGSLHVVVRAFPPDRRRRDLDNMLKAPLDALTHAGLWLDDSQVDLLAVVREPVVRNGLLGVAVLTKEEKAEVARMLAPMRAVCDSRSARVFGLDARACGRCVLWMESTGSFPYGECGLGQRLATAPACESFMARIDERIL